MPNSLSANILNDDNILFQKTYDYVSIVDTSQNIETSWFNWLAMFNITNGSDVLIGGLVC